MANRQTSVLWIYLGIYIGIYLRMYALICLGIDGKALVMDT